MISPIRETTFTKSTDPEPRIATDPARELAAAVILRAEKDARGGDRDATAKRRASARAFLEGRGPRRRVVLSYWCLLAGIEPEAVAWWAQEVPE